MRKIALLGMPNTGKSTFFNRLTGAAARVGNWPGVTVELASAKVLLGAQMVEVIDLPGIYDLHGFSEDERVVRHFLESNSLDLAVLILNAVQIERQLALALQIQALGLPVGTIRATVLIETILAAFEMDEILFELKDHSAGLNCGRWDYIFSVIKKFSARPEFVMPDRVQVTMTTRLVTPMFFLIRSSMSAMSRCL